jgi:hypothetical protein
MADTHTQASEAGRALANLRWRGRGIDQAVETLIRRADELTPVQLREVAEAIARREDVPSE